MRILKRLLTLLLITWGVLALAMRLAAPLLEDYRSELAAIATERLGTPVEIGQLSARWFGFRPLIEARQIQLGEGDSRLHLQRVMLDVRIRSLIGGNLADALRITIDGLALTVTLETDGRLYLSGLGEIGRRDDTDEPAWLPAHLRLLHTRLLWIDKGTGKPPLQVDNIALLLDRDAEGSLLRAHVDTAAGSIDAGARVVGPLGGAEWDAESYLRISRLDVARLLAPHLPHDYGLQNLELDLESWINWRNGRLTSAHGRFDASGLRMRTGDDATQSLELAAAGARFELQQSDTGLQLGLDQLRLDYGDRQWPASQLALSLTNGDQGRQLSVHADYLRLDDLVEILQVRPPAGVPGELIGQLQPGGEIRQLQLQLGLDQEPSAWRASAVFDDIEIRRHDKLPGIVGLSGRLVANQDQVAAFVDSRNTEVDMTGLFRGPLQLDRIHGRIDAERGTYGWRLRADSLAADAPHLKTVTRFVVQPREDAAPFVDLQTDFRDGDATAASRYYPSGIMGPPLVRWLDRSIIDGRVISGSALFHGPVDEFAFDKTRSGSFQVVFDTDDVVLDYREGWPRIEGLDAHVKFHGNQLDIHAHDGRIYDSRILKTHARISSLHPISPLLVEGRLQGPLRNKLRVLQEPALHERFGAFAEGLKAKGNASLALDFAIPLSSKRGEYRLGGRLDFGGGTLTLPEWDFQLDQIQGQLGFTLDGLSASGIRARGLGAPLRVDVDQLAGGATRIQATGRLGVNAIRAQLKKLPLHAATGSADFLVSVEIPSRAAGRSAPTTLTVESDLRGIGIDLPAPFGKTTEARRDLRTRVPLSGTDRAGSVSYGRLLSALFTTDGIRTDVMLGGTAQRLHAEPGVRVGGRLETLDLAAWQQTLNQLPLGDGGALPDVTIDLQLGQVLAGTLALDEVHLSLDHRENRWQGKVQDELLAGRFTLPDDYEASPVQVELDHLVLKLPKEESPPGATPDPATGPDPRTIPGLRLNIERLQIDEGDFGRLELLADRVEDGLQMSHLSLRGGLLKLDGSGQWLQHEGERNTWLTAKAGIGDAGELLAKLGYSRQIADASATLGVSLGWPGHPGQLHRETVAGKLDLDIGSGRLVEVKPGVGRIVGLMNLNALTRRLRLDFKDIFKKGYSFDSMKGEFTFGDGHASTDEMLILGPTGKISLRGSTDLLERTLDQEVTVIPDLDATLPIASALAGGPAAGVAVFVAQKLLHKEVDQINRFEYRLSGPWNDPKIDQLGTGGALSKLLSPFTGNGQSSETSETPPAEGPVQPQTGNRPDAPDQAPAPQDDLDLVLDALPETNAGPAPPPAGVPSEASSQESTAATPPLRGLRKIFGKGRPHGSELPGMEQ